MSSEFNRPTLPAIGWVKDLSQDDRDLLATYGDFQSIHPDHDMIRQGDRVHHVYLILSGKLEARRFGLDDDIVMRVIEAGECLGEVSMFDPGPASASIRALEFTQTWRIDDEALLRYLQDTPTAGNKLMLGLAGILAHRVRVLNSQLVEAKTIPNAFILR